MPFQARCLFRAATRWRGDLTVPTAGVKERLKRKMPAGPGLRGEAECVREWAVPGYTEVKALGSGGFGEVVLARHGASGTLVAVKYLRRTCWMTRSSPGCSATRPRCWPRWMTRTWSGCMSTSSRRPARRS